MYSPLFMGKGLVAVFAAAAVVSGAWLAIKRLFKK